MSMQDKSVGKESQGKDFATFSARFTGTLLKPSDLLYFSNWLQSLTNRSLESVKQLLVVSSPRKLLAIQHELLNLRTPGIALTGFYNEGELSYPRDALRQFFELNGYKGGGNPSRNCLQILAAVTLFLNKLPSRLVHVPSSRHLAATAEAIGEGINGNLTREANKYQSVKRALSEHLGRYFIETPSVFVTNLHEEFAKYIWDELFIKNKPGEDVNRLFRIYLRASNKGTSKILDQADDISIKTAAAEESLRQVFIERKFPALLVNGVIGTYAGEEL